MTRITRIRAARRLARASSAAVLVLATAAHAEAAAATAATPQVSEVVVTASTVDMLGKATSSSEGAVTKQELELRPVYRVGQLLETVPGLVVTTHSGEGKANQYLLRGFNLDHGTDLATFVGGMPVNERTHAHGQGYTDMNYLIPELASGIHFTKGPYYADEGDFSAVGSNHLGFVDNLPTQVTVSVGTVNDERVFAGTTFDLPNEARLIVAGESVHLDGPWTHPDNLRKVNTAARYVQGDAANGFSVTGLYYHGLWNATTDQPERAIAQGLIGRYGTLDPSDGGTAERFSLSAEVNRDVGPGHFSANAYVIRNELVLFNNFTHFLDDPIHGDQHAQNDRRITSGGEARYDLNGEIAGMASESAFGVQGRYDKIYVDARHTEQRQVLSTLFADNVREWNLSAFGTTTMHVTDYLRVVGGLRIDHFEGDDHNIVGGASVDEERTLAQPKGSLIFGPWEKTELYLSAGEGFHSNDVRAGTLSDGSVVARPPFLVKATGYEVGVRTSAIPHVQAAATLFQMEFDSELTYDADVGQTTAGRPGRRQGVELTGQYRPYPWIELNANLAFSRARYTDHDPAGNHIEDAPAFVGNAGVLIDNLGPWFGAVELRDLGAHALIPDNSVRSKGYREVNLNVGYKVNPRLKVQIDVFNVFNSKSDAADYLYADRLPGEPAEGVNDVHIHPLEPISARLAVTATF
jgi:outer membrane receptor protein involved in Fe transport